MPNPRPKANIREKEIHQAVGKAISRYAQVEFALAEIIRIVLRISFTQAHVVFFSISSIRSRLELIETLLVERFTPTVKQHWNSRSGFLQTLAGVRNAVAHWHSSVTLHLPANREDQAIVEFKLSPPPGPTAGSMHLTDLELFTDDCMVMMRDLHSFVRIIKKRRGALPKKYLKPIPHRNQVSLQPPQTPKAQQPQRPPSRPKLSRAQKRAKALKDAHERKKKQT
jgi:hypothetical protein